ncbi:MAG TPA: polysaccharide deacetylase family protein [Thermoanaerobaculia bacterium]
MRRLVKTLGAHGLRATGVDRVIGAVSGRARQPLVLCYHRVVEDVARHEGSAPAQLVSLRTLEAQLDWIGRRYRFASLDEVARSLEEHPDGTPQGKRPLAAVTFDDGYADAYRNAYPLLVRKGIPGAFFVVTGLVGTDRILPHDELYLLLKEGEAQLGPARLSILLTRLGVEWEEGLVELKERTLDTRSRSEVRRIIEGLREEVAVPPEVLEDHWAVGWPMLREMHAGGMTVGSHTRTHRTLPNEPEEAVWSELAGSKRTLEDQLGAEVRHLSYPGGLFSRETVEAAAAAGYRCAYTTCSHTDPDRPLLTIPRRTFWELSSAGLAGRFSPAIASCQVQGVLDLVSPCRADHGRLDQPRIAAASPRPPRSVGGRKPAREASP